jgi:hypothetical protein
MFNYKIKIVAKLKQLKALEALNLKIAFINTTALLRAAIVN